ncbi:UNVERIFIED_CONTAM: hypothetical protein GTU68_048209 [Idotea baltica]|nr:hypothetical protein [Idotea baltica]
MLTPSEFARIAVCHGTIATVSDPHEIGNVLGKEGVRFMIDNGLETPFKFCFGAPSCVPATNFETAGAEINLADLQEILNWPEVNYLAEMMNYPGVLHRDPMVMDKIKLTLDLGKTVDGHAPGLRGKDAKKYIEAGISTDHECFTKEEALDKLKHGMKILIREGSAAKNFEALWELIDEYPDQIMLCSDDKHPNDLIKGHINKLAQRAMDKGCNIFNVLKACSLNPIRHYKIEMGLLQVNDPADFCIVEDLKDFKVTETYINGIQVAKNGKSSISRVKSKIINNFHCSPISIDQIQVADKGLPINIIKVEDGQLVTKKLIDHVSSQNNLLASDLSKDYLKLVVVNRYENTTPSVGFINGFGLQKGALASCVAHDSHNIIAVGVDDESIVSAINSIIHEKGGVSLSHSKKSLILGLPIAGIMSNADGYHVAERYEHIDNEAKNLGSTLNSPFMTLSFCALLVIPELKLSDKGLFDAGPFALTDLFINQI